jgi:apolipoprotein N-acyltransferase
MAVVRAIENKRYIARAANTGISGLISPIGEIVSASAVFSEASLTGSVSPLQLTTLYTRFGDVFAITITVAAMMLLAAVVKKR